MAPTSVVPATLLLAVRSGKVHGRTLAVYVELHDWLDEEAFRKAPAFCIADRLRMNRSHVYRALAYLVRVGFLEGGDGVGTASTYRIARGPESPPASVGVPRMRLDAIPRRAARG